MSPLPRAAAAFALVALWSAGARATETFPGVVQQTLSLPAITVDPPKGCRLCHQTDDGGPALRPFGQVMRQYGVKPYDESSLKIALAQIQLDEPRLLDDIRAGRDPNDDTGGTATLHSPQYGCTVGERGRAGAGGFVAPLLAALAAVIRRRRAGRRSPTSGATAR